MRRWSLRARFLILLVVLLLAIFIAITLIIVRQNSSTLKTNLIDQSKSFAALSTQPIGDAFVLYKDSGTIHIQQQVQRFTDLDPNINQVEVVDTNGQQLFASNMGNIIRVAPAQAVSINPSYIHDKNGRLTGIVQPYLGSFGIHSYAVVYGISYKSVDQNIQGIVTSILILSAIILLVSLLIWYILINRLFLRPVAQLSQLALVISKGDLDRQIRLGRQDEIGDLADAVNTMASSLKADIAKLKEVDRLKSEFLMITSHNLRTPLTIIDGYLDQIKSLSPSAELQRVLKLISTNVTRLKGFSEDVLTISTIEAGQTALQKTPLEMGPLLKTIADEFTALAKQKNLKFTADVDVDAQASLSKTHFRSALWNLLDNAYKFTPEGGSIELSASLANDQLEIDVKDSGIGISAAEIPQLFTKFHRGTDTLQYDYEGTGIGLYIAKLIIEQHDGRVEVESEKGKGSRFRILLPVVDTKQPELGAGENPGPPKGQAQQDDLNVQSQRDESEGQKSIEDAVETEDVNRAGVGGSDAVGHDLPNEHGHQNDKQDGGDKP